MNKKVLVFLIILVIIAGGFFYFWYVWLPAAMEKESQYVPEFEPPTLFAKDDYQIEERPDGKYIIVEKVGLSCKVPEGWKIEVEGSDIPEPEHWVNLYSLDFGTTTGNVLKSGCIISITAQTAEQTHRELIENIEILKKNPEEATRLLREDYVLSEDFRVIKVNNHSALELISSENPVMGGGRSVNIPFKNHELISLGLGFPLAYKEKCSLIWEEFLATVIIK